MKAIVKFTEKSNSSRVTKIKGLGNITLNLHETPFEIAGDNFSAKTLFNKGEKVEVKFLTLYENGKKYHTPIDNNFELIALKDTIVETEHVQFIGERTIHSTEFEFDVERIKLELFAYKSMSPAMADAFDTFEEGGKIEKQPHYKDTSDMYRENDGR